MFEQFVANGKSQIDYDYDRLQLISNRLTETLHDPGLPGLNFNLSSRDSFHPTITRGN